jgi:broad specificity phosphatase PhoE
MIVLLPSGAPAQQATQLVILVRHAEKASCKDGDSVLSKRGQIRAQALVAALQDKPVKHIVTTQFKRTQETAAPLAEKLGIQPRKVKKDNNTSKHVEEVVKAVRSHAPETVLVVGHSDTVPKIIGRLKGPKLSNLPGNKYSILFLATVRSDGTQLAQDRYGDMDPKMECE